MTEEEKTEKLKELINRIADCYGEPDEEQVRQMRELTGIEWDPEEIEMICCDYWECNSLEATAYYLMHEEWPDD